MSAAFPGDLSGVQLGLRKLEEEAKRRQELLLSRKLHEETVLKDFIERAAATCLAWISAKAVFFVVSTIFARGDDANVTPGLSFAATLVYMILACSVCPVILWSLRKQAGRCKGRTLLRDSFKLVNACVPMTIAWAMRDTVKAFLVWTEQEWWDEILLAIIISLVLTGLRFTPCFKRNKAAVGVKDKDYPLIARYAVLPLSATLALGWAWNEVALKIVSTIQEAQHVAGNPWPIFLIQFFYYMIVTTAIIAVTAWWTTKSEELQEHEQELKKERQVEDLQEDTDDIMDRNASHLARTSGELAVSAMSFIYAWAMANTNKAFFCTLMFGCSGSTCSYQVNILYAIVITIINTKLVMLLKFDKIKSVWNKTHQSLQVTALSMTVGFAWSGACSSSVNSIVQGGLLGTTLWLCLLLVFGYLACCVAYHQFLKETRIRLKQFREEIHETRVTNEELGAL